MPPPTSGARRVHDRTGHRHRPSGPGATLGEHLAAANSGSPVELTADLIADPRDASSENTAQKAAFEARLQTTAGHGPHLTKMKPTLRSCWCKMLWTRPNRPCCSTDIGTTKTGAAYPTAAKSSTSRPTTPPKRRGAVRRRPPSRLNRPPCSVHITTEPAEPEGFVAH